MSGFDITKCVWQGSWLFTIHSSARTLLCRQSKQNDGSGLCHYHFLSLITVQKSTFSLITLESIQRDRWVIPVNRETERIILTHVHTKNCTKLACICYHHHFVQVFVFLELHNALLINFLQQVQKKLVHYFMQKRTHCPPSHPLHGIYPRTKSAGVTCAEEWGVAGATPLNRCTLLAWKPLQKNKRFGSKEWAGTSTQSSAHLYA